MANVFNQSLKLCSLSYVVLVSACVLQITLCWFLPVYFKLRCAGFCLCTSSYVVLVSACVLQVTLCWYLPGLYTDGKDNIPLHTVRL